MKKTALFRRHVMEEKILMVPVAHDALCARIAQKTGFKAVCSAGYANTAALLGKPDVSLLGLSEMVDCAWRIADATELPVLADGDTGHGNVTNVVRTVRLHEKAGVAALIIEDQVAPKRCGHMSGKQVIPVFEMEAKIKAAVDARIDPDFVIVARTDAIAVNGLNDALERAHRYVNAGADFIFVEAPETVEQMSAITREIRVPTLANMVPGGKTPVLTAERLQEIGFSLAIYPTAATYVIAQAVSRFFDALLRTGDLENLQDRMILFDDFNDLVGLAEIQQTEEKYYGHAK
ncbi:MAG: oxaloacetate decarboxylase [Syntrophobacteraceae bacterium]|nr:oxaloacetate decarboxylase [Syntrophobacteraceae bacterium]